MNVFRLFSKMGGQRVATTSTGEIPLDAIMRDGVRGDPDVAAFSSLEGKRLCVFAWHYHDEDVPGPDAAVELTLAHLPMATGHARLTHYRIDATHSNAFTVWQSMGSPTAPNDAQYAQLVAAGQLATLGEPTDVPIANSAATLAVALPRQAVSLLVLEW
jgi:xylan 1,4-beta-xylosidase